jgi:BirA family biotin operon repressor/biotin-[acetyl-CoA-carboxylase] ligase
LGAVGDHRCNHLAARISANWLTFGPRQQGGSFAVPRGLSAEPVIEVVDETGSTNADLLGRVAGGEVIPEGYWLRAERQTGGRGRLGRSWESPKGNLFCSTVINLRPTDPSPATLSMVTGIAVAVGVGMNVSYAPDLPDKKTTSIVYENGKFANGPEKVLPLLAGHFADRLARWREAPLSDTLMDWTVLSHRYNDKVRITGTEGEPVYARYRGIDREGALKVQPIGERETIVHAGDVTLNWHDKE